MRTTIRLNDALLLKAKKRAAETRQTLTALIEDALRQLLERRPEGGRRARVRLKTFKGNGLLPGVDLDSSASLLELMEPSDGAP